MVLHEIFQSARPGKLAPAAWLALCVLVAQPFVARAAPSATDSDDRAVAAALFDEGRKLMDQGDYGRACPKLEESLRRAPGVGIRFNLADCYEQSGKVASAWLLYREVAAEMARAGDAQRETASRMRMDALEPRVSKLRIEVVGRVPGLTVERDGRAVTEPLWGTAIPIDPGTYHIKASASGYGAQTRTVEISAEGEVVEVKLGPLTQTSLGLHEADPASEASDDGVASQYATAGWACFGVGLAMGTVSAILLGVGFSKVGEADETCPERSSCEAPDAIDLGNEGRTLQLVGYVLALPALATLATGIGLLGASASADDEAPSATDATSATEPSWSVSLGPTSAALRLDW